MDVYIKYVCLYIYIYIYMRICICIWIYIYVYVSVFGYIYIYIYTKVVWKFRMQTNILSCDQMRLFFEPSLPYGSHTTYTGVAVLGSHYPKMSSRAERRHNTEFAAHEFFSSLSYPPHIYILSLPNSSSSALINWYISYVKKIILRNDIDYWCWKGLREQLQSIAHYRDLMEFYFIPPAW